MSQNPYSHASQIGLDGGDEIPPRPMRTSILAIFSLICSVICCIPGLGLLGSLLGIGALVGINSSKGRVGGKGLAIAGVVVGLIITIVWLGAFALVSKGFGQLAPFGQAISATQSGDYGTVRSALASGVQISDEQIDQFGAAVRGDYGSYVEMPTSVAGIIGGWVDGVNQIESGMPEVQRVYGGAQVIPLSAEFDAGDAMCFFVTATSAGPPRILNVGVVGKDGSIIWLIDPSAP